MPIYWLKNNPAKFYPDSMWNDGALVGPNKNDHNNNGRNIAYTAVKKR